MMTVEEFMADFLRRREQLSLDTWALRQPVREQFFAPEYLREASERRNKFMTFTRENPSKVLDVEESVDSAVVTTIEPISEPARRFRYYLQRSGDAWLIHRNEWECFACKGAGRNQFGSCDFCNATGWKDLGPVV